jgi:hypothetical protein
MVQDPSQPGIFINNHNSDENRSSNGDGSGKEQRIRPPSAPPYIQQPLHLTVRDDYLLLLPFTVVYCCLLLFTVV